VKENREQPEFVDKKIPSTISTEGLLFMGGQGDSLSDQRGRNKGKETKSKGYISQRASVKILTKRAEPTGRIVIQ